MILQFILTTGGMDIHSARQNATQKGDLNTSWPQIGYITTVTAAWLLLIILIVAMFGNKMVQNIK